MLATRRLEQSSQYMQPTCGKSTVKYGTMRNNLLDSTWTLELSSHSNKWSFWKDSVIGTLPITHVQNITHYNFGRDICGKAMLFYIPIMR